MKKKSNKLSELQKFGVNKMQMTSQTCIKRSPLGQ
jgi:hypothetical protein